MVILGDTYYDTITDLNLVAFTDRWQALGGPEITFSYDKVIAIPGRSAVAIMFFDGDCFSAGINVPAEVYLALMGVRI